MSLHVKRGVQALKRNEYKCFIKKHQIFVEIYVVSVYDIRVKV